MIELVTEQKLRSHEYLRIRCEFYDLWNRLFINKNQISGAIFRRFGRLWPVAELVSLTGLRRLWFIPKRSDGAPLTPQQILLSTQLPVARNWEYPWAILNSDISPDSRILDVGSGCSLFPLYLAQKSKNVDSTDTDEGLMRIVLPVLADILRLKVNYFVDNALNLSAKDNTYDYVFCISVLEHLEQELENGIWVNKHVNKLDRTAIREFLRVVRPGGRIILTLDYGSKRITPVSFEFEYVKDLLEEFSGSLLKPLDNLEDLRFTEEEEKEVKKLWPEFYPYRTQPFGTALGIILTKR
ncbi:class I SAM-dependent methyltransferase [Chloroflexota bacterium]